MLLSFQRLLRLGLALLLLPGMALAAADDPPGRVGRLADAQGRVSWYDAEQGQWADAQRNLPVTAGDRLSTDPGARAEVRIGSTTVRLGGGSELEFERLDDEHVRLHLLSGSLAVRLRQRERADELDIVTPEVVLQPLRAGHYRVDRDDDTTFAGVLRGDLRVGDPAEAFVIPAGRRVELYREEAQLRHAWTDLPADEFADWVAREDRRDNRSTAYRYVSPEMTGAEDLDQHGRWETHPEYGTVWVPVTVAPGWAPYRHGRWTWVRPWGWTWVDDAPWGFAPFHYGRWTYWRERWCWTPGPYVARPVYAPALVAWVGGSHFSAVVSSGPAVGWLPLAPRDPFVPWYRYSPYYGQRLNPWRPPGQPVPAPAPTGPIMYGNQGVPGAVTVVPRDVLQRREPVARQVIDVRTPLQRPLPVQQEVPEPIVRPVTPVARPVPPPPGRVQPIQQVQPVQSVRPVAPAPSLAPTQPVQPVSPVQQARPVRPVPEVDATPRRGGDVPAARAPRPQVQPVQPPHQQAQPVQPVAPVQPRPERAPRNPQPQPQGRPQGQPQERPQAAAPLQVAPARAQARPQQAPRAEGPRAGGGGGGGGGRGPLEVR